MTCKNITYNDCLLGNKYLHCTVAKENTFKKSYKITWSLNYLFRKIAINYYLFISKGIRFLIEITKFWGLLLRKTDSKSVAQITELHMHCKYEHSDYSGNAVNTANCSSTALLAAIQCQK